MEKKPQYRYDRCQLWHNANTQSFLVVPYNETTKKYDTPKTEGFNRLLGESMMVTELQKFTDIIDSIKLIVGNDVFTRVRVEGLWQAFIGQHDLFWKQYKKYFFN